MTLNLMVKENEVPCRIEAFIKFILPFCLFFFFLVAMLQRVLVKSNVLRFVLETLQNGIFF